MNSTSIPSNHDLTYKVQDTIFLSDYTIESLGANRKLKSESIILIEDFVAKSDNGNLFKARLGRCGGGIDTLQEEKEEVGKN